MANTDAQDSEGVSNRYRFVQWLSEFFRGDSSSLLKSGSVPGVGGELPPVAMLARKRMMPGQAAGPYSSRLEEAKQRNEIWANSLRAQVNSALRAQFHPENYARMRLMPSLWTNVMRRVIEDISLLYENPAKRTIKEDKSDPVIESKLLPDGSIKQAAPQPPVPPELDANGLPMPVDKQPLPEPPPGAESPNTGDPDIDALAGVLELEGSDKKQDGPLDNLLKHLDLDVTLALVEHKTRFQEAVWVRPMVSYPEDLIDEATNQVGGDPASAKLKLLVYDPSNADIIEDPDDPSCALAWYYWGKELTEKGDLRTVIHFYTKDQYWKLDDEWRTLIPVQVNPIGRLPVTVFRKELPTPGKYFCEGVGKDLHEATIEFCVLRTIQNGRYRDSGFKQLALSNVDDEKVTSDQVMGGPTPIYIPEGGTASVLDMEPNLQPMTDTVEQRSLELAATYGISPSDYKNEGGPQSGFAKKLDRDKVLKENRRIRKFFIEGEKDLLENIALTLQAYPITEIGELDPEAEYVIDFAEPSFEEDPKNQSQQDAQDLKLNKVSIVDVMKRDNPDLSEIELVRKAYKNKTINEALIPGGAAKLMDILSSAGAGVALPPSDGGGGKPPFGK